MVIRDHVLTQKYLLWSPLTQEEMSPDVAKNTIVLRSP